MRIGIDIDDTISKTNEKLIEEALQYDQKYLKGKGFKDKEAYSFMEMFYWNVIDVDNFMKYFRNGNSFLELEPLEDSVEVINKLYDEGNEIFFITRRKNKLKMKSMTKKWLKKQGFKYNKVFFEVSKKGDLAEKLGLDVFLDNDEKNVYDALESNIRAYLMDSKYNKEVPDLERVHNWKEFYKFVKEK